MKKRKKAPPWESESQFPSESESNHGRIVNQKEPSFTSCLRESPERLEALKALLTPMQAERANEHGNRFGMSGAPHSFPITTSPSKHSKAILPGKGISDRLPV